MKTFRPHGIAHLSTEGEIVVITPDGNANRESIDDLMQRLAQVVPGMHGRWGALLRASANILLIPEAEAALSTAVPQLKTSGLRGLAVVRLNPEIRHLLELQYTRIFGPDGVPLHFCDTEEAARAWLSAKLGETPN